MMSMCWLNQLTQGRGSEAFVSAQDAWSLALMTALLAVCVSDILWRRVANAITVCSGVIGLGLWTSAFGIEGFEAAVVAFAACFILAIGLYAVGVVGAAD